MSDKASNKDTGGDEAPPARKKDAWDKTKILLAALIPLSIAFAGQLIAVRLGNAELEASESLARAERSAQLNKNISEQLASIGSDLFSGNDAEAFDLGRRMAAIAQLAMIAQSEDPSPPAYYFNLAVGLLTEYVRVNAQKRLDDSLSGVWKRERDDPSEPGKVRYVYRAVDIMLALRALQAIRLASADDPEEMVEVRLTGVIFNNLSLQETPGLDLSGFDFTHSHFEYSLLTNCICNDTDFHHAKMKAAAVWNAEFKNSRFLRADISFSKWANVDFTGSSFDEVYGSPSYWEDIVPPEKEILFR